MLYKAEVYLINEKMVHKVCLKHTDLLVYIEGNVDVDQSII